MVSIQKNSHQDVIILKRVKVTDAGFNKHVVSHIIESPKYLVALSCFLADGTKLRIVTRDQITDPLSEIIKSVLEISLLSLQRYQTSAILSELPKGFYLEPWKPLWRTLQLRDF